jgi:hypothetical protein
VQHVVLARHGRARHHARVRRRRWRARLLAAEEERAEGLGERAEDPLAVAITLAAAAAAAAIGVGVGATQQLAERARAQRAARVRRPLDLAVGCVPRAQRRQVVCVRREEGLGEADDVAQAAQLRMLVEQRARLPRVRKVLASRTPCT